MIRKQPKDLSPTEWKVMKIIWSLESGAAREIHQIREGEAWHDVGNDEKCSFPFSGKRPSENPAGRE